MEKIVNPVRYGYRQSGVGSTFTWITLDVEPTEIPTTSFGETITVKCN